MLNVIAFGEALIDMLATPGQEDLAHPTFTQYPGGAPANVAVAVAKLGAPSYFVGKVGRDLFGDFLIDALAGYGVNTDYVLQTDEAKTALAFVSLDANGERSFAFYRDPSADLLFRPEEFQDACFARPGIFHCCSNTLTEPGIRDTTRYALQRVRRNDFLISFDVNYRANLWPHQAEPQQPIWDALIASDVVKMSREELHELYGEANEQATLQRLLDAGVALIIVTDGGQPLQYYSAQGAGEVHPPATQVVDTTAGGDAFVGGLLYSLAKQGVTHSQLAAWLESKARIERTLAFATACGAHAVSRYGAYNALPTLAELNITTEQALLKKSCLN